MSDKCQKSFDSYCKTIGIHKDNLSYQDLKHAFEAGFEEAKELAIKALSEMIDFDD